MMKSAVFPGRLLILGVVGLVSLWGVALESGDSPAGLGEGAAVSSVAGGGATVSEAPSRQTIHVDDDAPNDPGPGDPTVSDPAEDGSAGHPFDAVQEGIDAAVNGDEVLLADGTYTGVGNRDLDFGGRLITVRSENGADACIIDCQSAGRGFYFHSGEDQTAVVEGLTITNGYVVDNGGAVYCDDSSPTLSTCKFTANTSGDSGAAMYNNVASPTLIDCTFTANTATGYRGGGMYNVNSSPMLTECTFLENTAGKGGGMLNDMGAPTLVDCTFAGNTARDYGGGMYNDESSPTLTDCIFNANSAHNYGGGMYNEDSSPVLVKCAFVGNSVEARDGGGLYNRGSATLTECTFIANIAYGNFGDDYGSGGGVYASYGSPTFTNCTFAGNSATDEGGGIYIRSAGLTLMNCTFSGNSADFGGGLCCDRAGWTMVNCTLSGNVAVSGGGVYQDDGSLTIANSVLWGNTDEGGQDESAQYDGVPLDIDYSCVQGWTGALGGIGNIGGDPLLVDPDGVDNVLGTQDDNLRLAEGSACVDAGRNGAIPADTADLDEDGDTSEATPYDRDGDPRRYDDPLTVDTGNGAPPVVDMGAYEYPSDCNGNGVADIEDIAQDTSEDCNENRVPDECDVAGGTSADLNGNGVPDECEGVCCTGESCAETNEVDCLAGGGVWVAGTVCPPGNPVNPCGPGTCCTCPGICTPDLSQADCLALGGSLTPGGTCDPNPCPDAPANDDCASAEVISGLADAPVLVDFDNTCATDDGATTGCAAEGDDLHFDFWYTYTAEDDGRLGISTCGLVAWDSMIAVYDGGTATCVPAIDDEITCDDDGCGMVNGAARVYVDVAIGQEPLIRVGGRFDPVSEEGDARGEGRVAFALVPDPPSAPTSYPNTFRMNRVLSFLPNNPGAEVAFQLELLEIRYPECYSENPAGDVGMAWWVSSPRCTDDAAMDVTGSDPECTGVSGSGVGNIWRSQVTVDPVCHGGVSNDQPCTEDADCPGGQCGRGIWPDGVVHIADCEIIPVATYALRTTPGPAVPIFSTDLVIGTIERPSLKCWGDTVGRWDGTQWTPPEGVANIADVMAAVMLFQKHPNKPHRTWIELADESPDMVLNFTDIFWLIRGFKGRPYPYANPSSCP